MNCWDILGLDAGADERTIKRHYARLLKNTRPDEDHAAFQALREAYEQALRVAQWRAEAGAEAVETLVAVVETAVLAPTVRPLTESAVPVVEADQRPRQLAELLTELRPLLLTERRLKAEAAGMAVEFERGVLRLCLKEEWESILRDAACAEYGWLEVRETRSLQAAELFPLYEQILHGHLLQIRALYNRGEPQALVDGLQTLRGQAWLQSYDGRALLESSVVSMLLEMPSWKSETLDALAGIFGWKEGLREANCPDHHWQALLQRWGAERFYTRILANAERWELTPECRAARLILAPLDSFQRRRFMADFTHEDRQQATDIARMFIYRYPQLLERLPGAPLDDEFWRDLGRSGPWFGRTPTLWFAFLVLYGVTAAPAELAKPYPDMGVLFIGIPVVSAVLAGVLNKIIGWWEGLTRNALANLDYRLSGRLPASWHEYGAGIRPLWHGAISYLLALVIGGLSGLAAPELWLKALFISPGVLLGLHLLKRNNVLARCGGVLIGLWLRHRRYLHVVILLALAATVVTAMMLKAAAEKKPRYQTEAEIAQLCEDAKHRRDIICVLRDTRPGAPNNPE